jgi:signal transduction histidine kinase
MTADTRKPVNVERLGERSVFLSMVPPSAGERRLAAALMLASLFVFLLAAPFAQVKLVEVWAFIPSCQSALLVCDLITAALMFAQFSILRAWKLLILASGYLFSAVIAIAHALSFPRLFAPDGLLGAGPQTTAWLYMAWHAGFPLAVIAYAWLPERRPAARPGRAIAAAAIAVAAIVCAAAYAATAGHALLPAIMLGDRYTPAMAAVVGTTWGIGWLALLLLWLRRPRSALDLWLLAVMWAWVLDVALSAVLNAGRFDVGFYAGRVYGFLAASLVLVIMLIETGALYARMTQSFLAERREREEQLQEMRLELIHVSRLTELGQMVSALAHEVNQPLTAVGNYLRAGRRLLQAGETAKADDAFRRGVDQVTRAGEVIHRLRQFVKKAPADHRREDVRKLVEEAAAFALIGKEGRETHLAVAIAPETPAVRVDKVQIQQVLLNLIRNAVEAMQASERREVLVAAAPAEGMVEISVRDTGPGISAEVRERLFQPFVTTKATGMGVGLAICRSIVTAHGGRMWVADNPVGGAAFHLTVPVDGEAGGAPAGTDLRAGSGSHTG